MRLFKGNRTRLVAAIIATLGAVEQYGREVIPDAYQGFALMAVAIAMIWLRQITTTPPGEKF